MLIINFFSLLILFPPSIIRTFNFPEVIKWGNFRSVCPVEHAPLANSLRCLNKPHKKTCIFVFELVCKCVCYVVHTWKSGHKHACVCVCNRLHTSPTAEGRGFGEGVSKGVKTNAVGNEMQCAKCIFRDYTIEVINHNGRWKSRGYTFLGVRLWKKGKNWCKVCELTAQATQPKISLLLFQIILKI